jgi:effector-binding domain-containing protein
VPAVNAVAIIDVVGAEDSIPWLQGALAELRATLAARDEPAAGPAGGIYHDDVFTEHRGKVTVFVPVVKPVRPTGRVTTTQIPAAELALIEHRGPPDDVDRAYGTLATYVARHAIAVEGPIREYYLVGQHDTPHKAQWRTEIGWPIFQTSSDPRPQR